jgi:hypothetical protein
LSLHPRLRKAEEKCVNLFANANCPQVCECELPAKGAFRRRENEAEVIDLALDRFTRSLTRNCVPPTLAARTSTRRGWGTHSWYNNKRSET